MTPLFGQPLEPGAPKYTAEFSAFWECSSKRGSKLAAFVAWKKLSPCRELVHGPDFELIQEMYKAMAAWQQSEQWQAGIIPHVSTWLNRRGWEEIVPRPAHVHTKMCREFGFCSAAREDQA